MNHLRIWIPRCSLLILVKIGHWVSAVANYGEGMIHTPVRLRFWCNLSRLFPDKLLKIKNDFFPL